MPEPQASDNELASRLDPPAERLSGLEPPSNGLCPKGSPEYLVNHQRLLDCLVEPPDRTTACRFETYSESDWTKVIAEAGRHGIAPLLYERLTRRESSLTVPDRLLRTLRESFLMNGAKNALLYQELARVLRRLHQDHLPFIVLKGAHLAALVYDNPALRTMNDIDLLVPKQDLARAVSMLGELGYASEDHEDTTARHQHWPRMYKPPGPGIELHWAITSPGLPFCVDIAGLWERARPATIAGVAVRILSPEDLLLHICVHTASQGRENPPLAHAPFRLGLRPICDIAATVRRHKNEIIWQQVQCRALEWQAGKCVYVSLWLARKLLQVEVPGAALEFLQPGDFDPCWSVLACEQVALAGAESGLPDGAKSVLTAFMNLTCGYDSRWRRGEIGLMRLLLQAAFPSRARMAQYMAKHHSVPLSPIRSYLCYLTRLLDWFGMGACLVWSWATRRRRAPIYGRQSQQRLFWNWLTDTAAGRRSPDR